ncbi:MAG: toll/interleukin-1 receptor domain-containing protein [Desulfobacterales bacterium]|nr:toll/interleukin-1 receptor domain-containing protein [Desulfobacterales bacterium]
MADKEHFKIFRTGVKAWNKWKENKWTVIPDLRGANLQGIDLQGIDLQEVKLQGAKLREADLQGAKLRGTDLRGADLYKTDLRGAKLQNAKLQGADLREAYLHRTDLRGANLQDAKLQGADLREADLHRTNLQSTDFSGANLHKTKLQGANLHKSKLRGVDLRDADLRGADLQNADLRESTLQNSDLRGAYLQDADLRETDLQYTDLQEAKLESIRIDRKTLRNIPEDIQKKHMYKWYITGIDKNLITRSIKFPPEYHQAGISILNYFSTVLRKKYPDVKATVQIKQEDLKVTMIIDPLEGKREVIEKALDEYGLVVTGKMMLEEYTDDRLLLIELKSELRNAQYRIETQKELLQYQEREMKKQNEHSAIKDIQIDRLLNLLESGLKSGSEAKEQLKEQPAGTRVFISCAEKDILIANQIYADIQKQGIIPWMTRKDIKAGEKTEIAGRRAIKDSNYFLALLSTSSVNERGAFQKELKQAFDMLAEFPQGEIFIVPVRLDDCNTNNEALNDLHIIDLHKTSWNSGLQRIIQALQQK